MSFFENLKARLGDGSLKVDLQIEEKKYTRGEKINGVIHLSGGNVKQKIDGIFIDLMTENDSSQKKFGDYKVYSSFLLAPKQSLTIPFDIILPDDCPLSKNGELICLITRVSIPYSMDSFDKDYLTVLE